MPCITPLDPATRGLCYLNLQITRQSLVLFTDQIDAWNLSPPTKGHHIVPTRSRLGLQLSKPLIGHGGLEIIEERFSRIRTE